MSPGESTGRESARSAGGAGRPDLPYLLDDLERLAGVKHHRPRAVVRSGRRRAPPLADAGQRELVVDRGIADHRLRVAPARGDGGLLEHPPPEQDDAAVALAE